MTKSEGIPKPEGRKGHGTPDRPSTFGPSDFFRHWSFHNMFRVDTDAETIFVRPESLGKSVPFNVPMLPQKRKERRAPVRLGVSSSPGRIVPNGSSALRLRISDAR